MTAIPPVLSVGAMPIRPVALPPPGHAGFEALVDSYGAGACSIMDEALPDMSHVGGDGDLAPPEAEAEAEGDGAVQQPASAAADPHLRADLATLPQLVPVRVNDTADETAKDTSDDAIDDGDVAIGQDRSGLARKDSADNDRTAIAAVMPPSGLARSLPARVQPVIEQAPPLDVAGRHDDLRAQAPRPVADLPETHSDNARYFAPVLPGVGDKPPVYPTSQVQIDARTVPEAGPSREIPDEPHGPARTSVTPIRQWPAIPSDGTAGGRDLIAPAWQRRAAQAVDLGQPDVQPTVSDQQARHELVSRNPPKDIRADLTNGQPKAEGESPLRSVESLPRPVTDQAGSHDKPAGDQTRKGAFDTGEPDVAIAVHPASDRDVGHARAVAPMPGASGPATRTATSRPAMPDGEAPAKVLVTHSVPRREGAEQAPAAGMATTYADDRSADPPASATTRVDMLPPPQSPTATRPAGSPTAPETHHAARTSHTPGPVVEMRGGAAHATVLPDELGRIDIRVERGDGGLSIFMRAERPESADLMRRNADILQRELAESGVGHARLEFSQSNTGNAGNSGHGNGQGQGQGHGHGTGAGQAGLMGEGGGAGNPSQHQRAATAQRNLAAAQPGPGAADGPGRPRGASDRMDVRL